MVKSAMCGRAARRRQTMDRITARAQELTLAHGLDGFTMDDLAVAADVSRRTLFNYFPGKVDAVLGAVPDLDDEALATFHAGGPHGDLVSDVTVLARSLISVRDVTREDVTRIQGTVLSDPRLMAAAHERFGALMEHYLDEIRVREGADFDPARARIVITVLASLLHGVFDDFIAGPGDGDLGEAYGEAVRIAREALAPTD